MSTILKPQPPMSAPAEEYAATALKLSREVQATAKAALDIPYGSHEEQKIDLYMPDDPSSEPMPVLVFIHGGGWTHGYKDWMGFMAPAITRLPAIFISVGYRLAPGTNAVGQIEDCRNSVKWAYENVARYGGDPDKIFVGGHSAGGHLSAQITLQRDGWKEFGLPEDVIKGCFPVSGVFDFADNPPQRSEGMFDTPEQMPLVSPISYIAGNTVRFFIVVGDQDLPGCVRQAPVFAEALRKEAGSVELSEFEDSDHFKMSIDCGDVDGVWAKTVRDWMAPSP